MVNLDGRVNQTEKKSIIDLATSLSEKRKAECKEAGYHLREVVEREDGGRKTCFCTYCSTRYSYPTKESSEIETF